ncbi:MAG TPA: prefoldin subunit [Candidatus Thalassarchaeaceae archaeon]|jgi:chaperonin cofactor prefoldin|nr:prefoldin subunit [Candidatus Thalassarchaeaceae archaeon]|tara:strand:+ start:32915 stop:33235 length:321 start_codon:yes stop_codon:yes gene_type:complete
MSEGVSAEDIQSVARELQIVRNQIQTISSQVSEYGITIEALSNQDPSRPIYRSLGNILLEVEDREVLLSDLEEAKKAVEEHLKRLIGREDSLRKQYENMAEEFEGA